MRQRTAQQLTDELRAMDGRSYGAYKAIRGEYAYEDFVLRVDYVQGDPFASPSKVQLIVNEAVVGLPEWCAASEAARVATRDFLARRVAEAADEAGSRRGSGKSGMIRADAPGQQILERAAVLWREGQVAARVVVGLPAQGRRIAGRQAAQMFLNDLPEIVDRALRVEAWSDATLDALEAHVRCAEDAVAAREQLDALGLVAFVADGAILPRRSGVDDRPLSGADVVPFRAPEGLRATIEVPHAGRLTGLGLSRGVSLIVGGGYHGKSTLLQAIMRGVATHIPGDGRERVFTDPRAVKIRAEDGRSVSGVDISAFINDLPDGRSTTRFSSADASGSTSQAAAIAEALEVGATTLLMDEDTCATNFMIRDDRMRRLVAAEDEPITPFLDRARQLHDTLGVSTILVIGGSGDYFKVADTVLAMRAYTAHDVTAQAHAIAAEDASPAPALALLTPPHTRTLDARSIDPSRGRRDVKITTRGTDRAQFGDEELDLRAVELLVEESQLRMVAHAMARARDHLQENPALTLPELLRALYGEIAREGLDVLTTHAWAELAMCRPLEVAAALNRLRTLSTRAAR